MNPIIELSHVYLKRQNQCILNDVNWRMDPRQHWALLGLNGSGKTSLLTLIMGYEWPTNGTVSVLGHRYGTVDLRQLRKRIGWVSHHLAEWITRDHGHTSVRDLINAGHEGIIGKGLYQTSRTEQALETFQLMALKGARFSQLSQGEKTRILLARAWTMNVDLLILDEPMSGLDIRRREELFVLIGEFLRAAPSVQVIYVTHHPEEIRPEFTHALLLKEGQVIAQGPRDEVLTTTHLTRTFDVPVDVSVVNGRLWMRVNQSSH